MKKMSLHLATLIFGISLVGCSTMPSILQNQNEKKNPFENTTSTATEKNPIISKAVGGNIAMAMDENDKSKMAHALDKPLGKATQWANGRTGVHYTVVPNKKLVLNGNPFCRQFTVISIRNDAKNEIKKTACVSATDSSWQVIN
jgi:surface antigen